jgi:hypothetical protein
MRINFLLAISIYLLFSCNSPANDNIKVTSAPELLGDNRKRFFDYDEVVHYCNPFDEPITTEFLERLLKSEKDSLENAVILGIMPRNISDTFFISKLKEIGFDKKILPASKFPVIDSIFSEKKDTESISAACVHVYRDLLIFKKAGKVIGTVKICFDCQANQIHGTNVSIEGFGADGDYRKLQKLLRK